MNDVFHYPLICFLGPSGVGKSTIAKKINLPKILSYRTRPIRKNEKQKNDGYFISEEQFQQMDQQKRWLAKTTYAGYHYGITQNELAILKISPAIYIVDYPGLTYLEKMVAMNKSAVRLISIFINAPKEHLISRMQKDQRDLKSIQDRVTQIEKDLKNKDKCDYLISNIDLKETVSNIIKIIEHNRQ
jgi:guanylate kinase